MAISNYIVKVFLFLALLTVSINGMAEAKSADDVKLIVSLDRDTIGFDEQAMLQILVEGSTQNLPNPKIPTFAAFEVYSQGRSSNISIVNGKVSSSVTYRYMLMPHKKGTFLIDNIAIVHNNSRFKGNPVKLTVLNTGTSVSPQLQDQVSEHGDHGKDYFLEAVVDNKNPYVNEQVTLTLKFYTAIRYYGNAELSEPTTTGFWNELLGNKAPYKQRINNRTYKVIERKYAVFPTQTGPLTIGRATIHIKVPTRNAQKRDPFGMFDNFFNTGKKVAVRSKPIRLNVRSLPDKGRPDDFTGSIGDFKISASVDKRQVEVNQPVTLTLRITGTGNIKAAAEPVIPELDDFRIDRASSSENISKVNDRISGTKVYEELFIPKHPGTLVIPSISYNYFVPSEDSYREISTKPIKIRVTKPEGYVTSSDIPYANSNLFIGSEAKDIRYIKDDLGETSHTGELVFTTPAYLIVNGLSVLMLAGMILVRRRREKLASDISYARSRYASKAAKKRLVRARSLSSPDKAGDFFSEVHLALISYIADKLNISPHGLTTDYLGDLLAKHSADEELIGDIVSVLQRCDFGKFAPTSITQEEIDELLLKAEQIMIRLASVHFA
ncbi:MAG: BatD family protein [candidate division Zixibacteria bacterium]|nr:BatD family protein [candidate division Zixibacteria bacterium]